MMFVRSTGSLAAVLASLAFFSPTPALAAETDGVCNAKFARQSLAAGDFAAICACQEITVPFILRIQRDRDFGDVLNYAYDACPLLASLLTDTATASLEDDEHERGGDPVDPEPPRPPSEPPVTVSEPPPPTPEYEIELPDNGWDF